MRLRLNLSTTKIAAMIMTTWLGIHFSLPTEYWVISFFVYVGINFEIGR